MDDDRKPPVEASPQEEGSPAESYERPRVEDLDETLGPVQQPAKAPLVVVHQM